MDYINEHLVPPSLRTAIDALITASSRKGWGDTITEQRYYITTRGDFYNEEGYISLATHNGKGVYRVRTTRNQYGTNPIRPEDITAVFHANKRNGTEPIWLHPSYVVEERHTPKKIKPDIHDATIALLCGDNFAEFEDDSYPVDHILFEHRKF